LLLEDKSGKKGINALPILPHRNQTKTSNHLPEVRGTAHRWKMRWYQYNSQGILVESWKPKKEKKMTINDFAKLVCSIEGLKVQLSIAQVLEVLKIVNKLLGGMLYRCIRNMEGK
jgi:hypothetical protein